MKRYLNLIADSFQQSLLLKGSFFAFLGATAANFFTYLFQLLMGRLLIPADYGTLIALRSVIPYIFIFATALSATIVKKTAEFKGQESWDKITKLFTVSTFIILTVSVVLVLTLTAFAKPVAQFLQIKQTTLIFLLIGVDVASFLAVLPLSFLQGLLRFRAWAFLQGLAAFLILIFSVGAVKIGLGLSGVLWANILAVLLTLVLGFFFLQKNLNWRQFLTFRGFDWALLREIFVFAAPVTLISFSMMAFFNTDILLVKHFFDVEVAGVYSAAAILGRIIFFGTSVVGGVLLPVISERVAKGLSYQRTFGLGLTLVLAGSLMVTSFYVFLPELTIKILFGGKYLSAADVLGWMGVFMTLYALLSLLNSLFLSLEKTKIFLPLLLGSFTQAVGIWFFHENLTQVIKINSLTVLGLLCVLVVYYLKLNRDVSYG